MDLDVLDSTFILSLTQAFLDRRYASGRTELLLWSLLFSEGDDSPVGRQFSDTPLGGQEWVSGFAIQVGRLSVTRKCQARSGGVNTDPCVLRLGQVPPCQGLAIGWFVFLGLTP